MSKSSTSGKIVFINVIEGWPVSASFSLDTVGFLIEHFAVAESCLSFTVLKTDEFL